MRDAAKEPPDFVNSEGVKWRQEPGLTGYAESKGLAGSRAWLVERPDGYRTRLLTDGQGIIAEDQTIEGLGVKIDALAFQRRRASATDF